jgi:light-regulated signal transduction histidine kinase (bacteriophytochrome)
MDLNPETLNELLCADEPIRVPGATQPHGFLLGLPLGQETVVFASENAGQFLRRPTKLLLGAHLELILDRELLASVRSIRGRSDPEGAVTYLGSFQIGPELFSVLTHRIGSRRILEFERQDRLIGPEMMNAEMTNFVAKLSRLDRQVGVCQALAQQFSELTGFDRVLLYSFDEVGHGTVIAEVNNGTLPSYLDLRFPASDIPSQARALYVQNTVRIIPNAVYDPVPLQGVPGEDAKAIDMSLCVLRSVAPVHLEYMRNMGTMSSMSVSIICEGRLWGLISGHHSQPLLVPFLVRSACDLLSKMVGTRLTALQAATQLRTLVRLHDVQRRLLTQIAAENDYLGSMSTQLSSLMGVTDSDGVVLALDGDILSAGLAPPTTAIRGIIAWLNNQSNFEVFNTNHLSSLIPWAEDFVATASGLLAIRISDVRQRHILWFRQEVVTTVKWAGEPATGNGQTRSLHPRLSFASWKETLRGQSIPWSSSEIASASEFRSALNTISLRRAEEEADLSAARFNKLTHTLPIKIFAVTDDAVITYVNARWVEEGFIPEGIWYASGRLHPEDSERCAALWRQSVENETEFEEEVRFLQPGANGLGSREVWNLVHVVPFRRRGSNRAGWIGAGMDLTEIKQRENNLRVADKLALTSRMTSYFAHEVNNPLEALTNLVFLLKSRLQTDQDSMNFLGLLEAEFERIAGTVKQTLRWTAENSDKESWSTVREIYEDVIRLYSVKIRNRGIQIGDVQGSDIKIFGIVGQIRQVVAHLFSNAIDSVPDGGLVTLQAEKTLSGVDLIVIDRGCGLSPEEQRLLFQPFYSTKGDLGNGLGLYISKEIVERHRETITIDSSVGQGTTVRVRLPT